MTEEARSNGGQEPIQLPIDGVLDLHTFQPKEIMIIAYLAECQSKHSASDIHGKGIIRRTVHALLARSQRCSLFARQRAFWSWGAPSPNFESEALETP